MVEIAQVRLTDIDKIPLFQGLTSVDLEKLIDTAHHKSVQKGEFFFIQGDFADRMFILIEGRVKLFQTSPDGEQVLIHMITPVSLFALVAMTQTQHYPVSARAAADSQAIYWSRQELAELVKRIPMLALNAMQIMAVQVKELQERLREATTERVDLRLAHTLVRLSQQKGRKVGDGILIDLRLTRQDIAEMSGTTQFTASRLLKHWESRGWVVCHRNQIIVRNPQELIQVIEGDFQK